MPTSSGIRQAGRMITLEGVSKSYGGFTAVDDVSFTAQPGRVTGFLGPNGAGKSTSMRIMVGLTHPDRGTATIGATGTPRSPTRRATWACCSTPLPSTQVARVARCSC
jgi:ABC-type multidrug transport system ATPase subunit